MRVHPPSFMLTIMLQPAQDVSTRRSVRQMRRRRKCTLEDMLYSYSVDCYSQVHLVAAEYPLPYNTAGQGRKQVVKYFTIDFLPGQMPDCNRSSLQRMRNKRKASLDRKLREYAKKCYTDIYIEASEFGISQVAIPGGWREERQSFSLNTNPDSTTFPPSQKELDNHYPPVNRTTLESYIRSRAKRKDAYDSDRRFQRP
ncbi:hypothetical protein CIRG_09923 [Coccidioides immitis RMSCC 2394]|uniref:Uncharacterized protein n=1 Tax=Coccidioides immitis RMSCC 2394 TaxID=404692 RepID=A0A0J7BIQ1_COCIT|nr:hypothetical protein CIRG_09923 [Coccidioides immitis RMSCC 2394]